MEWHEVCASETEEEEEEERKKQNKTKEDRRDRRSQIRRRELDENGERKPGEK